MTTLEDRVTRWRVARQRVLALLNDTDAWMKPGKGGGREVIQPLPTTLAEAWTELSRAETSLAAE